MLVQKYICPKCEYSQAPTTHIDCHGIVVKITDKWVCNKCFKIMSGQTSCSKCGHRFDGNCFEIDMRY